MIKTKNSIREGDRKKKQRIIKTRNNIKEVKRRKKERITYGKTERKNDKE